MARGDHIYINNLAGGIPFQHHGIDMGDGTVIHLASADRGRVTLHDESGDFAVRRDSLDVFCEGHEPKIVAHADARNPEDVARTAESLLGKVGYNLLDNNCEHFATLCATGRAESQQIEMSEATVSALSSMATKAAWSISGRLGGRLAARSATRVHPAVMLADGVELATLAVGCRTGMSADNSRRFARLNGALAAAGIGAIIGGPAGAAICMATHTSSGMVADRLCKTVRRLLS